MHKTLETRKITAQPIDYFAGYLRPLQMNSSQKTKSPKIFCGFIKARAYKVKGF